MAYDLPLPCRGAIMLCAAIAFAVTTLIRNFFSTFQEARL
jgi:hypothetical protein